jgi:hypothetical protein
MFQAFKQLKLKPCLTSSLKMVLAVRYSCQGRSRSSRPLRVISHTQAA